MSTKWWWSTQCNPDLASVWLWIRDSSGVAEVTERMFNVAKGALMAGVEYDIKLNNGLYEILTNETGAKVQKKT
jgi:hypothetical protein